MNRLARERSPYLLQHAQNPVEWFPWGDEAFARARAEDKPIFLSIGYSTCHWCHVMEHESFENDAVAAVLNENYVSIKVDREERPDVDRVYMAFVQATTGSGGWPMSVWLTPELKPFYGGTYFPPTSQWGRPGFTDILREIARVWQAERAKVLQSAEAVTNQLRTLEQAAPTAAIPGAAALERTVTQFKESFDRRNGGFGAAPKFPRPSELLFLLREHARTGDAEPREVVLRALRAMALGGMRDHIGGGFHRYSVDAEWRVPHFEKMLYDQAQLAVAFIEAGQVSGDPFYTEVAEDTLFYVQREMTDATGGFHSAEDADSVPPETSHQPRATSHEPPATSHQPPATSHKKEGAYYLWRDEELDALLGDAAPIVKLRYGIEPGGNAPQDPQQEFTGKNLLYVARSIDEIAKATTKPADAIVETLNTTRVKMFQARLTRPRPHRDDKILTSWNGLMIGAFARMARVRGGDAFLQSARRAAVFIRETMWHAGTGVLMRRYRDGHAEIEGYAEDYAYLIAGLLELFQADADPVWLEWAIALQRKQDELFWDASEGGWFSTTGQDPTVLLRMKEDYDGAEPTASSVSVLNLMTLSHLVHDVEWIERIERTLRLFGERLEKIGRAVPMMSAALSTYLSGVEQIVIVEERISDGMMSDGAMVDGTMGAAVRGRYLPFAITLHLSAARKKALAGSLPWIAAMNSVNGAPTVYVCRNFACRQPMTDVEALWQELRTTA
jgi:uncharacterized protein YyaL (SSP411 family)